MRAIYGTDDQRNALHGSESFTASEREIRFFFPDSKSSYYYFLLSVTKFNAIKVKIRYSPTYRIMKLNHYISFLPSLNNSTCIILASTRNRIVLHEWDINHSKLLKIIDYMIATLVIKT